MNQLTLRELEVGKLYEACQDLIGCEVAGGGGSRWRSGALEIRQGEVVMLLEAWTTPGDFKNGNFALKVLSHEGRVAVLYYYPSENDSSGLKKVGLP